MLKGVSRTVLAVLAITALARAPLQAGTISIEPNGAGIILDAKDATIDEVLAKLGELEQFEVSRAGEPSNAMWSGRYSGAPLKIVARILENESHIIEYAPQPGAGIARILLLGKDETPSAPESVPAIATSAPSQVSNAASPRPMPLAREIIGPAPATPPVAKRFRG